MEWFKEWFDSPYYHLLYGARNDHEAWLFIDNLLAYMHHSEENSQWNLFLKEIHYDKYLFL